jgi:coenzyme Q-binding protein COQ10
MPTFSSKRRVRHSASDMFDLVADVEHYPEFVPMCKALEVRQRCRSDDGREIIVADMTVSFKLVRETFRSRVTLDQAKRQILVEYLQGPFSHMQSRTLGMLMGGMFDLAFRRFAAAFEARADQVYGRKTS